MFQVICYIEFKCIQMELNVDKFYLLPNDIIIGDWRNIQLHALNLDAMIHYGCKSNLTPNNPSKLVTGMFISCQIPFYSWKLIEFSPQQLLLQDHWDQYLKIQILDVIH